MVKEQQLDACCLKAVGVGKRAPNPSFLLEREEEKRSLQLPSQLQESPPDVSLSRARDKTRLFEARGCFTPRRRHRTHVYRNGYT